MNSTKQKLQYTLFCHFCHYFPHETQIINSISSKTIFKTIWQCPICLRTNQHITDQFYRVYTIKGNFYSDETLFQKKTVNIVVLVDQNSDSRYLNIPMHPQLLGIKQINKRSMYDLSTLLQDYYQSQAVIQRKKNKRYFNWQTFIDQRQITKIEYALWIAHYYKQKINAKILLFAVGGKKQCNQAEFEQPTKELFKKYFQKGQQAFYSMKQPRFIQQILTDNYNLFVWCGSKKNYAFDKVQMNGQLIILKDFQYGKIEYGKIKEKQQLKNKQLSLVQKSPFKDDQDNICTQLEYLKKQSENLENAKFKASIFVRINGKYRKIYSKNRYCMAIMQSIKSDKSLQLFKERNYLNKHSIQELILNIHKNLTNNSYIKKLCEDFANRIPNQIKLYIQIYQLKICKKISYFFHKSNLSFTHEQTTGIINVFQYLNDIKFINIDKIV